MKINKKYLVVFSLIALFVFLTPPLVLAQADKEADKEKVVVQECSTAWYADIENKSGRGLFKNTDPACWACGNCTVCDFLGIANGIAILILGIMGAVAFVFFLYGGISFIIAAGNSEKITQAKSIFKNAIIGLVIILLAWEIVNLVIGVLAGQGIGAASNIFGDEKWYDICKEPPPAPGGK